MKEPARIFLTKGQFLDLAEALIDTEFDDDYILELQYIDEVGLDPEIRCVGSYCDNFNLVWNNDIEYWDYQ